MGRIVFSSLVILLFLYIASPLLLPVFMGGVLAVLFYPWLQKLEGRGLSTRPASAILTLGVMLVLLFPAAILIFFGAKTGLEQLKILRETPSTPGSTLFENLVQSSGVHHFMEKIGSWFPIGMTELLNAAHDLMKSVGIKLADLLGVFLTQLPGIVMGMVIAVISVYFFLADGRALVSFIRKHSVLSFKHTDQLMHAFAGMCRSVILATLVSGAVQAFIYSIACMIAGVNGGVLIGFLVFLASFLPLIGSSPITIGIALYTLLTGNSTAGIVLLVVAVFVAVIDNLIRPMVLKGSGNLHPLLAFIAAFGGLQAFGFAGVFVGPIIAGLFVVTVQHLTVPEEV